MESKVLQPKDRDGFEIAIICALRSEADAVEALFDEYWDEDGDQYGKALGDTNSYTTGVIGRHNVVLAHMPGIGKGNAASVASSFRSSFGRIKLALVVGICGGVPAGKDQEEIILGDVIISTGIIQYDFGRQLPDKFIRKDTLEDNLGRPNTEIRAFLSRLEGLRGRKRLGVSTLGYLEQLCKEADFQKARYPGAVEDRLYEQTYRHKHHDLATCATCANCETKEDKVCENALELSCTELKCSDDMLVQRQRLRKDRGAAEEQKPSIHFGRIASGDTVLKSGEDRDAIAAREKVIGFEMEGIGVWDQFPCVVIKGVCDYADSHKNKKWQAHAAATAAACMKAFLKEWVPTRRLSSDTVPARPKAHWIVPFGQNRSFVGREALLEEVIGKLTPDHYQKTCQRVAVTGLGGIGKTQIALEAAFQIQSKYPDCSVFWISAVNTTSFEAACREIGQALQIVGIDNDKADVKSLIKTHLSQEGIGRWLLIVDNADDLEALYTRPNESGESFGSPALANYLPFSRLGSILLTTRNHKVAVKHADVDIVTVKEMSESESLKLLEESLIDKALITEKSTTQLLKLLTYLPLAIKQAAAFINQEQVSIYEYVEACESGDQELIQLLSENFEDQGRYESIKNPIALTWLISFRQLQQHDILAAEYLYFMSCIAEQGIPRSLLPAASNLKEVKAIGTLKAYAFIVPREGSDSYDIHRLVQIAARNWLKANGELTRWSCEALKQVTRAFPFFQHDNRDICTLYLPHAQCVLKFEEFPREFEKPLRDLLFNVGEYFLQTGRYIEAEAMYQQTLQLTQKVLGSEHPETLCSMNNLANVLDNQGKYIEAETMHRQTLQLSQEVLGSEHPSTLSGMNNLANVLDNQGKYIEAEMMHRQTLELRQEVLGAEHPETLSSMNNLANVLDNQGKYVEAETMHRQTLQLRQKVLGVEHPETLSSMNNLANVLDNQDKYVEAEVMHRQTLQLRQKMLCVEHLDTLRSMDNLATVLDKQGKYVEAETNAPADAGAEAEGARRRVHRG